MTLQHFIDNYDFKDSVILLEGKREVKQYDTEKLIALGTLLVTKTNHMVFRSGNAHGADFYFSEGVCKVNRLRLQVITPYSGHRKKSNIAYETISLGDIDLVQEPDIVYQSKSNKKTEKLIDQYVSGFQNRNSIKAAYIIRDTVKVIGSKKIPPATFGIFYDDLANPRSGGTGHTMNVCESNQVPMIDQQTWFSWL